MVWARQGSATAEKIKPNNKVRMFVVHHQRQHNNRSRAEVLPTLKFIFGRP
jgi:hypothetical protein